MKKILIRSLRWCLAKLEGKICEECPHPIDDHYDSLFVAGTCTWQNCRCVRMAKNIRTIRGLDQ
jgi:hypothetical protein